jgi:hypothetical protein
LELGIVSKVCRHESRHDPPSSCSRLFIDALGALRRSPQAKKWTQRGLTTSSGYAWGQMRPRVRFGWGWVRDRVGKALHDRRRSWLLRWAVFGTALVGIVAAVALIAAARVDKRVLDPSRQLQLPFAPHQVVSGEGLLYVASESGDIAAYDPRLGSLVRRIATSHPVDFLAVYRDHVFAAGQEAITRLSPRLTDRLTRPTLLAGRRISVRALAGGPAGLWMLVDPSGGLVHLDTGTLVGIQHIHPDAPATALAVGLRGVWTIAQGRNMVTLTRARGGRWHTTLIRLPCNARTVTAEHDRAYMLCTTSDTVYELSDIAGGVVSSFRVAHGGQTVTAANGAIWLLSPSLDRVSEYDAITHAPAEAPIPIPVGPAATQLAVDQHAVWVGESIDETMTRVDLAKRALDRTVKKAAASTVFLGLPLLVWALVGGVFVGIGGMLVILAWQYNANRKFPSYFPPRRILVYLINRPFYEEVASSRVGGRTRRRRRGGDGSANVIPLSFAIEGETETTQFEYPLAMHVRETVIRLSRARMLYRGLNYVPGLRHRGTRRSGAPPPTAEEIQAQFADVAAEDTLCLIPAATWTVEHKETSEGAFVYFTLEEIHDRTLGHIRVLTRPAGTHLWFRVRPGGLEKVGKERCTSGARVKMDVIAQTTPPINGQALKLDLVVAWQRAPDASEWRQARDYLVSEPPGSESGETADVEN